MKDPLGVSPSKGNQGTTRGKEKILLTSVGIEPTCFHSATRHNIHTLEKTQQAATEDLGSVSRISMATLAPNSTADRILSS